jgi:signal transduction histidine kinase
MTNLKPPLLRRPALPKLVSLQTCVSAVMLVATVPLALLLAYQMYGGLHAEHQRQQDELQRTAALVAASVERELRGAGPTAQTAPDAVYWQELLRGSMAPGGSISLIDGGNRLIAHAGPPRTEPAAAAVYSASQPVPRSDWRVQVSVPAALLDGFQRRSLLAAISTITACLLLGLALATLVARRITDPLRELATRGPALSEPPRVQEIAWLRDALAEAQTQQARSQASLQRKAAEFEALFANTPIGLAFLREAQEGTVLHNAAMDALLGPAGTPDMWLHGQPLALAQQPLQQAAASARAVGPLELELRESGGGLRHLLMQAVPLLDPQGRAQGALASAVDITERKLAEQRVLQADRRLQESQRLIDLAQEAGEIGFFRVDTESATWTPGQARLFGLTAAPATSAAMGGSLNELLARIHPQDRSEVEQALQAMAAEGRERAALEFRVLWDDGSARWLSSRVLMNFSADGQPQQLVGATLDVTQQKTVELERATLATLEQRARIEAEQASRAKDEFLAMLGHELRNPLGAITSASEVLKQAPADTELAANARAIIERQTRHLARLVDDLLDVGRVISGKVLLSRHRIDLAALVERVVENFRFTGSTAQHPITLQLAPVWVDADGTRIEQVVNNLLGNALKYTPAGSAIELSLQALDGQAELRVRDHGDGIAPALLPHIFDLFVQGERQIDRRAGGLGIGLTLVRRLVELHGGTVTAESSSDGSLFCVRLPAVAAPVERALPRGRAARASRRVLLVEDNLDALSSLRSLLELDGHRVWTASDGPQGLARLVQERPDVAIVDIGLPGLSGFELAKQGRRAGYAGQLLALSGYGGDADVAEALRHGFDAHLSKPVDPAQLRDLLARP